MMKTNKLLLFFTVVVFSCLYASVNASSCESITKSKICKSAAHCKWKPLKKKGQRVVQKGSCTNIPANCDEATFSSQCNAVKTETCFWSKAKKKGKKVIQSAVCAKIPEKCSEATEKTLCTKVKTETCTWVNRLKTCYPKPCSSYKRKKKQCVNNERCQWLTSGRKKVSQVRRQRTDICPDDGTSSSTYLCENRWYDP